MRIGLFTEVYLPSTSGVATAVDLLKRGLEEKGHEIYVITVNPEYGFKAKYIKKGSILRIPGSRSNIAEFPIRITPPIWAINKIKSLNLDVIHTNTEFIIGRFGKNMAKSLGIPVVHTFHTLYEKSPDYFLKGMPNLSDKVTRMFVKSFLNDNITKFIVPSNKALKSLKNRYKVKKHIDVICTGIDMENYDNKIASEKELDTLKKRLGIKNDDFVITFAGRLGYEKKIYILIEAHKEIVKKHPNAKLLIVGNGSQENYLKELVKRCDVSDNVIFTGKVEHKYIGKYYLIADILATASDMETQGLTVLEAMAASCPVVCLVDDAFCEVVKENYNGSFFRDRKEYVKKVNILINNPEKLSLMQKNAYKTAEANSLDKCIEKIEKVYIKAIQEKNKKRKTLFFRKKSDLSIQK